MVKNINSPDLYRDVSKYYDVLGYVAELID